MMAMTRPPSTRSGVRGQINFSMVQGQAFAVAALRPEDAVEDEGKSGHYEEPSERLP
jgi:hypothetical protein